MTDIVSTYRQLLKDGAYPETVQKLVTDHSDALYHILTTRKIWNSVEEANEMKIAYADLLLFRELEVDHLSTLA